VSYPILAWSGSRYGVAWQDSRDGNYEIYFRELRADGSPLAADERITRTAAPSVNVKLVWNGSAFYLAWTDKVAAVNQIFFSNSPWTWTATASATRTRPPREPTRATGTPTTTASPTGSNSRSGPTPSIGTATMTGSATSPNTTPRPRPTDPGDRDEDSDGDGVSDRDENYNGTNPHRPDPSGHRSHPHLGCAYWGDSDGNGFVNPTDLNDLRDVLLLLPVSYENVIPPNGATQDMNGSGDIDPADLNLVRDMVSATCSARSEAARPPSPSSTPRRTRPPRLHLPPHVGVNNLAGLQSAGFAVVFEVLSGTPPSWEETASPPGRAPGTVRLLRAGGRQSRRRQHRHPARRPGPRRHRRLRPGCGTPGQGRANEEVGLAAPSPSPCPEISILTTPSARCCRAGEFFYPDGNARLAA